MPLENEASTGLVEEVAQVETPEVPVVEKTMDDTIRETLRSLKERGQTLETPAEEVKPTDVPESAEDKAQRIRDAQGKFAKAPAVPAVEAAIEPAPVPQPVTVPPEVQKLGLRKEEAEAFTKADPALQQALIRRSNEMFQGLEQYKGKAQFADSMERVLAPHMQTIQSFGVTPDVAVGALLAADAKLRHGTPEQKQRYLAQLAHEYGIDATALPTHTPVQQDPMVQALAQQVQELKGFLNEQLSQGKQQEQESLNSAIAQFAADPNHSHFETVKAHMAALLQAGQAKDLADAYEQAVWANPTTRAAALAEQQAKARQDATQKAQAAKVAASVNTRARPSMPVSVPIGSMDETIRATLRSIQQRA